MKYRLLALDVDGTLVGPDDVVSEEIRRALRAAEAAGLRVCLATGRSRSECLHIWRQIGLTAAAAPMICVGGAIVSEARAGRTLYAKAIPSDVATAFADAMGDAGYSAMAIVDGWRWGVDYYWTTRGDVADAQRRWFDKMDVRVRRVERLSDVPDMPRPLRISAVADPDGARELERQLRERFDGQLTINAILAPNYHVMIVEAHAVGADKLSALTYVAQGEGVALSKVAAVGDDVNDVPMVRGAGLGAAMPGAPDVLRRAADVQAERGLAEFVDALLAGRFDD